MSSSDNFQAVLERGMASAVSGLRAEVDPDALRRRGHRALWGQRLAVVAGAAIAIVVLGFAFSPRTNQAMPASDGSQESSPVPAPLTPAPPAPDPVPSAPSSAATKVRTMPQVVGLPYAEVEAVLAGIGVERFETVWIASPDSSRDVVIAQDPAAGEPAATVTITFSTGGPTIAEVELPAAARELLSDRGAPGEQVLVVETPAGTAYKVDALLFGTCAAVDAAYRTFLDPMYDDACY